MIPSMIPARPYGNQYGTFNVTDKIDGHRLVMRRGEAYRRSACRNEWDRLPATIRDLVGNDWLDGELVVPGKPATAVQTALAVGGDGLAFRPFRLPGCDLTFAAERARLIDMGWEPPRYLGQHSAASVAANWPTWAETLAEGVVLRSGETWFKIKRADSADLRVVSVVPGEGKFRGMIGALVCRLDGGGLVKVGSGLSAAQRAVPASTYLGRVVEVAFQSQTDSGSLRHPRFVRTRDDL